MSDLPADTMGIIVACKDNGEMEVMVGHNFSPDFDEQAATDFELMLEGLNYFMKYHSDLLHQLGDLQRLAAQALEISEPDQVVDFQADKALTEKVKSGSNIVRFPKGKLH